MFWAAWTIAAIITAIFVYFFLVGLADGSVSSLNIILWTAVVLGVIAVTGGSLWLKRTNRPVLATVVAMLLALPGLLAGLVFLIILILHPRWN